MIENYIKIRDAMTNVKLAIMANHKGAYKNANDRLTKVVRKICGLD